MKFNTTKRKIYKLFNKNIEIDSELNRKNNKKDLKVINSSVYKTPKVLYDSGWQAVPRLDSGITNVNKESALLTFSDSFRNGIENEKAPAELSYIFQEEIDIIPSMIPFVKVGIQWKKQPDINSASFVEHRRQVVDDRNYWEMDGDSVLLYKGYNMTTNSSFPVQYTQEELDSGDFLASHASNWFETTVNWTANGDSYEGIGSVENLYFSFNLSYNAGAEEYDYETFDLKGISSLSDTTVTGKGTHTVVTWVEGPPTVWTKDIVTTKNVTKSVNYREDSLWITIAHGVQYKNGVINGGSFFIVRSNDIIDLGAPTTGTITSVSDTHALGSYRLFYTSLWAQYLATTTQQSFPILPSSNDYESATLPYSQISFKMNPDPYPILAEEVQYATGEQQITWLKTLNESDPSKEKYQFVITGQMQILIPATVPIDDTILDVDETYSPNGTGTSYVRDAENRYDKTFIDYKPDLIDQEIRLQLSLINPLSYNEIQKQNKKELD